MILPRRWQEQEEERGGARGGERRSKRRRTGGAGGGEGLASWHCVAPSNCTRCTTFQRSVTE
eukprot:368846-Hanusia_phi.AAC.1